MSQNSTDKNFPYEEGYSLQRCNSKTKQKQTKNPIKDILFLFHGWIDCRTKMTCGHLAMTFENHGLFCFWLAMLF